MPRKPFTAVMTANGTAEPLTGWQFEYLPWPARVFIAFNASVVDQVEATVSFGSETIMEEAPVELVETANVPPKADQPNLVEVAAAGDRLKIRLREVAGGTPTVRGWINVESLI